MMEMAVRLGCTPLFKCLKRRKRQRVSGHQMNAQVSVVDVRVFVLNILYTFQFGMTMRSAFRTSLLPPVEFVELEMGFL